MTSQPPHHSPWSTWLPFLLCACLGGILRSTLGGILGGLIGGAGGWLLGRPWPVALRWLAALAAWGLGFGLLWVGGGFVDAVRGLMGARQ